MVTFAYTRGATGEELRELAQDVAPMELEALPEDLRPSVAGILLAAAARSRTYVARIEGRLAGICFVTDLHDRREMAFTKTRFLVNEHRIAFARAIPQLLRDLARLENGRSSDGRPMYMHTPEGDERSKEWFVRAGCVETELGLLCPGEHEEGREE